MPNLESLLTLLRDRKHRLTPVRKATLAFFVSNHRPLSIEELLIGLDELGFQPNKTTVYREMEFLKIQGIITELDLGEGKKRYELIDGPHHHHIVCTNCNDIAEVEFEESLIHEEEKRLSGTTGFRITRHMLEFFGLCKKCQLNPLRKHSS